MNYNAFQSFEYVLQDQTFSPSFFAVQVLIGFNACSLLESFEGFSIAVIWL